MLVVVGGKLDVSEALLQKEEEKKEMEALKSDMRQFHGLLQLGLEPGTQRGREGEEEEEEDEDSISSFSVEIVRGQSTVSVNARDCVAGGLAKEEHQHQHQQRQTVDETGEETGGAGEETSWSMLRRDTLPSEEQSRDGSEVEVQEKEGGGSEEALKGDMRLLLGFLKQTRSEEQKEDQKQKQEAQSPSSLSLAGGAEGVGVGVGAGGGDSAVLQALSALLPRVE